MKKMLAIVLTLVILASLAVPALAVEPRSHICPQCGSTNYRETEGYTYKDTSVSSCSDHIGMHTHRKFTVTVYAICNDCGTRSYLTSYSFTECRYPN